MNVSAQPYRALPWLAHRELKYYVDIHEQNDRSYFTVLSGIY